MPATAVGGAAPLDALGRDRRGARGTARRTRDPQLAPSTGRHPAPAPDRGAGARAGRERAAVLRTGGSPPPRGERLPPRTRRPSHVHMDGRSGCQRPRAVGRAGTARLDRLLGTTGDEWTLGCRGRRRGQRLRTAPPGRPPAKRSSGAPRHLGIRGATRDPAPHGAGLDRRAYSRGAGARVRPHQARRLAHPDGGGDRARRLLVQPGDVDRVPAPAPGKRAGNRRCGAARGHRRLRLRRAPAGARTRVLAPSSVVARAGHCPTVKPREESQRHVEQPRQSLPDHARRSARHRRRAIGHRHRRRLRAGGLLEFLRHRLRSVERLPARRHHDLDQHAERGQARDPQRQDRSFRIRRAASGRVLARSHPARLLGAARHAGSDGS